MLIFIVAAVLVKLSYGQLALTSRPISRISEWKGGSVAGIVDISLSGTQGCIHDPIPLQWRVEPSAAEETRIAIFAAGSQDVWISSQAPTSRDNNKKAGTSADPTKTSLIKCAINEQFCMPVIENVIAITKGSPSLTVVFQQETNEPLLSSTKRILEALSISPTLIGGAVGEWDDARTLSIAIEDSFLQDIVTAHSRGQGVTITPRSYLKSATNENDDHDSNSQKGSTTTAAAKEGDTSASSPNENNEDNVKQYSGWNDVGFRPLEVGKYSIFAVNVTSLESISNTFSYEAIHCDNQIILPTVADTSKLRREDELVTNSVGADGILGDERRPPTPALRIKGTLAVTGKDPIKVPQDLNPGIVKGNFALSFWIRFLEKPSGAFRSLFYKGNGVDAQRTPSAWLLPSSQRMAIRASTASNPDVGSDTLIEIPLNQWIHLTFSFSNLTDARLQRTLEAEMQAGAAKTTTSNNNSSSSSSSHAMKEANTDNDRDENLSIVPGPEPDPVLLVNEKPSAASLQRHRDAASAANAAGAGGGGDSDSSTSSADDGGRSTTSTGGANAGLKYTITNYVNGLLDINMQFTEEVVGNDGPLHLFKDISHNGARAFVRDLIIWDAPLSPADVQSIYASGPLGGKGVVSSYEDGVGDVLDVLSAALHLSTTSNADDGGINGDDEKLGNEPRGSTTALSPQGGVGLLSFLSAITPSAAAAAVASRGGAGKLSRSRSPRVTVSRLKREAAEGLKRSRYALSTDPSVSSSSSQTSPTATAYASTAAMAQQLYAKGQASFTACEPFLTREDLYSEAAMYGSTDALYSWAMLISRGIEESVSSCGMGEFYSRSSTGKSNSRVYEYSYHHPASITANDTSTTVSSAAGLQSIMITDQDRATIALIRAAEAGNAKALVPLAISLLTGVGAQPFLWGGGSARELLKIPKEWEIPFHPAELIDENDDSDNDDISSSATSSASSSSSLLAESIVSDEEVEEVATVTGGDAGTSTTATTTTISDRSYQRTRYRPSALHEALAQYVSAAVRDCNDNYDSDGSRNNDFTTPSLSTAAHMGYELPLGDSVLCWNKRSSSYRDAGAQRGGRSDGRTDAVTRLALGLLHLASLFGVPEADAALFYRYQHGIGVFADTETAAQYGLRSASVASAEFHRVGGQPIMEADRIDDHTEKEVEKGNKGNDDELIQHQKIRADEGDVPAMIATADLYYYGARGLPRDQPRALQYYSQAAAAGDPMGMCGAAAMHLKGEGTEKNVTTAVDLYEEAAALGSVKALNGLGYIYFYGQALPKNETKAFRYFLTASEAELDGDSLTNAAFCLLHGMGTERDPVRAAALYDRAARKFGSMSAITTLATMHMEGVGVPRSALTAMPFLTAASNIGPWSAWIRRGLDQYLHALPLQSLLCYLHAAEMGYEVSQSNAAFILRRKLKSPFSIVPDLVLLYPANNNGDTIVTTINAAESSILVRTEGKKDKKLVVNVLRHLQARELALSAFQGNRENAVNVGNMLFEDASRKASGSTSIAAAADARYQLVEKQQQPKQWSLYEQLTSYLPLSSRATQQAPSAGPSQQLSATGAKTKATSKGNSDSLSLGGGVTDTSAAVWWYSKASAAGSALGSMYVGTMHHFGTGVRKNPHRAVRYYDEALRLHSAGTDKLPSSLVSATRTLRWLASVHLSPTASTTSDKYLSGASSSAVLQPFVSGIESAVHYIWSNYYR